MKVEIVHYPWISNHAHFLIIARDAQQAADFYGQIKKQLTEAIKRLLGISHLNIWEEGGATVNHLPDMQSVMNKIAYVYLNCTEAHLESSIERYPHAHSWHEFINAPDDVDAEMTEDCPWIRQPMIPGLPARTLTRRQDEISGTLHSLAFTLSGFQLVCNMPTLHASPQSAVKLHFHVLSLPRDYPFSFPTSSANIELVARGVSCIDCLTGEFDHPPAAAYLFL